MANAAATNKFGNGKFRPLHVRDTFMFERGNVAGFATVGGETGVNAPIGPNSNPGAPPDVPFVIGVYSAFGDSSLSGGGVGKNQAGNIRAIDSELLFNSGTVTNAASVSITAGQSITAIRGAINIAQYTSVIQGYLYGVQGKFVLQGTLATTGGEYSAALVGQLDLSQAAGVTSALSALWLDAGATASAAIIATPGNVSMINMTNTTSALITAALSFVGNAAYAFSLSDLAYGGPHFIITAAVGGSQTTKLKVLINGVAFYIPLYTA